MFIQILWIFSCNKCILVRLGKGVFITRKLPYIHYNSVSVALLTLPISTDTKQVKQQKYRVKRNPIKPFTLPSNNYNKVSVQQYYIVTTPLPYKNCPPPLWLALSLQIITLKRPHVFALPNHINMTTMTRHHT